jgi:hypothetical protein
LGVPHIFGRKIVGGTVSPRPLDRKTIYRARQRGDGGRRETSWRGDASCALTFQSSNHSFIQLFEMQLPDFALAA